MDKETLSKYGWVVIVIVILVILMGFAAPFGQYLRDSTMATVESFDEMSDVNKLLGNVNNDTNNIEIITNYTIEEIEADTTMYAIGANKEEYVVADFNDDFTEVVITKNGENSDGLMLNWDSYNDVYSPMEENKGTLKMVTIENGVKNVGKETFYDCVNLKTVTVPQSITMVGDAAFMGCDILQTVIFPDSVTSIGKESFVGCKGLQSVTLPTNLKTINEMLFFDCPSLKDVTIPKNVIIIEAKAFNGCTSLQSITIPNSVTSIGEDAFYYCINLKSITIPDSVTTIGDYAFSALADNSKIYCESQRVMDLFDTGYIYDDDKTTVILDASKFN